MILVPHRCCFHFLFRSTTFPFSPPPNKAPQRTKSHRRTASATPSKAKVAYKHTQRRVHLNCWTPSLHSLKLGFSQGFMGFTWNFWDETNNSPLKRGLFQPIGKDHRLPTIHFQERAVSFGKSSFFGAQYVVAPNTTQGLRVFLGFCSAHVEAITKLKVHLKIPSV